MERLSMLQYNARRSRCTMATFTRDPLVQEYDIVAVQEPGKNPFNSTTHNPSGGAFVLIYPELPAGEVARVCFFVNKRIPQGDVCYNFSTRDLCTMTIKQSTSEGTQELAIHNVYNEPVTAPPPVFPYLRELLGERTLDNPPTTNVSHIILGDMNIHHPQWGGNHILPDLRADFLLDLIDEFQLTQQLKPGTITWQQGDMRSTVDLVFTSENLDGRVTRCGVCHDLDHDSDHFPIETVLDIAIQADPAKPRCNWETLKPETFKDTLVPALPALNPLLSERSIDLFTLHLTAAIQTAIKQSTSSKAINPQYSRAGFNEACSQAVKDTRRLRRKASEMVRRHGGRDHPYVVEALRELKDSRNAKGKLIKRTLRDTHRNRINEAAGDPAKTWKLVKWAKNRGTPYKPYTPSLTRPDGTVATEPQEKAQLLEASFFPTPPEADLQDLFSARYPQPIDMPPISEREITDTLRKTAPHKSSGPDEIPPHILIRFLPELLPCLLHLFNACWQGGHHPRAFRDSFTVVLRKPAKGDYTIPKSYRPIALLNTMGKALESIIATRISWAAEKYSLLPPTHVGGRKGLATDHAIHLIVEGIHHAWEQGEKASLLLLDVSGAFDNVSHERLLHNLRKRRLGGAISSWVASFIQDRTTVLRLPEFSTDKLSVRTGIPQGSPVSPILYLFYNADLVERCCDRNRNTLATGYIDDVGILATGKTYLETGKSLRRAYNKAKQWEKTHASVFSPAKYMLIHFDPKARGSESLPSITLDGHVIQASETAKYLGIILDRRLSWEPHLNYIAAKASHKLALLSALNGSTWGFTLTDLRKTYLATVLPQFLYCASVWYIPEGGYGRQTRQNLAERTLNSIQRRAAIIIGGAYRNSGREELDIEYHLLPVKQQLERHLAGAFLRITGSRLFQQIQEIRRKPVRVVLGDISANHRMTFRTPLVHHTIASPLATLEHKLSAKYGLQADLLEKKHPYPITPWSTTPEITIHEDRDSAIQAHSKLVQEKALVVYTDGSGINGKIGASAVSLFTGVFRSACIGPSEWYTVYFGELYGIYMAMQIALDTEPTGDRPLIIFTDNQASIRSTHRPGQQSGQFLLQRIAELHERLNRPVQIHWIPAHNDVPGNEVADEMAKEATGWRKEGPYRPFLPPPEGLPRLGSAAKAQVRTRTTDEWAAVWNRSIVSRVTHRYNEGPTPQNLNKYKGQRRAITSVLTQMRTGKVALGYFLHRINRRDSAECSHCGYGSSETVQHVLLSCERWHHLRQAFLWKDGNPRVTDLKQLLNDPDTAARSATFMILTGLLPQFREVRQQIMDDLDLDKDDVSRETWSTDTTYGTDNQMVYST